jgi:dihydrofolate synthase/folylpolyglutamate synthase
VRPGLHRTLALLSHLGDPHLRVPVLHVAGTNGKGSVVAMLASALRWRGLRVGTYTSPHLVDFRERVVVDGTGIEPDEVVRFLSDHDAIIRELDATFFEVTTALAFDWFVRSSVDVAVVEVGLGGLLDSTNVVHPEAAAVVSVDIDHVEYLGESIGAIAREKGGIFKPGVPAIIGPTGEEATEALERSAREAGASDIIHAGQLVSEGSVRITANGTCFHTPNGTEICTPLVGEHQAGNAAVALATLNAAGGAFEVDAEEASAAFAGVRLPGRFHRHDKWLFDVAHNPAGARVLARTMTSAGVTDPVVALVAVLSDKDWHGIVEALAPHVSRFVFTEAPSAPAGRVWDARGAAWWARDRGWNAEHVEDFEEALEAAGRDAGMVLVTGSFHTVGDAMLRLQVDPLIR